MIVPCCGCHPHGVGNGSTEPCASLGTTPLHCFLRSTEKLTRTGPKCGQGHTSKPPLLEQSWNNPASLRVTNNTRRRGPGRRFPSSPATVVAQSPAASREPAEGAGLPAAPPGRRRPPGRIKVRRAGRGGCSHRAAPNARPPCLHPGWAPPDTLRRRTGSVISVLPDPRGTRKYVGEKFPLPHGGEDVGGERAEDGEQRWEDVSGPRCAYHPSPGRAG